MSWLLLGLLVFLVHIARASWLVQRETHEALAAVLAERDGLDVAELVEESALTLCGIAWGRDPFRPEGWE